MMRTHLDKELMHCLEECFDGIVLLCEVQQHKSCLQGESSFGSEIGGDTDV